MALVKFCYPCQTEKPVSEFYFSSKTKDNLTRVCKYCTYHRYSMNAVKQRDLKYRDPLQRATSRENNSLRFLERVLTVYGPDTYRIDKTVDLLAEETGVPAVSVFRYLHKLLELGLVTRKYHNPKDRSMGYDWYIELNNPKSK